MRDGTAIDDSTHVEGASLLGAVGYLLTGATAPGLALALGVVTLLSLRPSRFELGEG